MSDLILLPFKGYQLDGTVDLTEQMYRELLSDGFCYFIGDENQLNNRSDIPVVVYAKELDLKTPQREGRVHMIFSKAGEPVSAFIDGSWINL